LAVVQRDGVEEAREGGHVARERLGLHLLAEVEIDVAAQLLGGVLAAVHLGQAAVVQIGEQVEVVAELGRGEGEEACLPRAASEQVGRAALELARARTGEDEAHAARGDEAVDLVEQGRQLLDLVDGDDGRRVWVLLGEEARTAGEAAERLGVEQVVHARAGQLLGDKRRLTDRPRAEEEEALLFQKLGQVEATCVHDDLRQCYGFSS